MGHDDAHDGRVEHAQCALRNRGELDTPCVACSERGFVERISAEPIDHEHDEIAASVKPLLVLNIYNITYLRRPYRGDAGHRDVVVVPPLAEALRDLVDEYRTDLFEYDHCHTSTACLKKRKHFALPHHIDTDTNEVLDARDMVNDVLYSVMGTLFALTQRARRERLHYDTTLSKRNGDEKTFLQS